MGANVLKIHLITVDLRTRLLGINPHKLRIYSPEPRTEVYCFRLNSEARKV